MSIDDQALEGESQTLRQRLASGAYRVTAKNADDYVLRPIRLSDADSLMRGYDAMSERAKWLRMLHSVPHLTHEMAEAFCSPDPIRDACLVIEGKGPLAGEILGGARFAGERDGKTAEFSVSLRPEAQGLGLARSALETVLAVAAEMGFRKVYGLIATANTPMLALARRIGFTLHPDADDLTLMRAEIDLPRPSPAG